jgi:hypothetical protein
MCNREWTIQRHWQHTRQKQQNTTQKTDFSIVVQLIQ